MLLEQLARKEKLNVDFHNHLQTGSSLRTKPKNIGEWIKNLFMEEGFSSLTGILGRIMQTNLDVLYITNSYDSRYEDWTSIEQIKNAIKNGYEIQQGEYYLFAKKGKRVIALGKSQEVSTDRGHILFSGLKRNKKFSDKKPLEEVLKEANDNELKIADHPYVILKGQNGIMATSKNPEQDAKKVDAFEKNGNSYFPFSFADWKVVRKSEEYNKPLIADSDGHHPRDIGETYNIFSSENLNYASERAFRDSLNNSVRNKTFDYCYNPIPPWRIFHHLMMVGIYYIAKKLSAGIAARQKKIKEKFYTPVN